MVMSGVAMLVGPGDMASSDEQNPLFQFNGNRYIISAQEAEGVLTLRAYKAKGATVWEPFGSASLPLGDVDQRRQAVRSDPSRGSIVERIYFTGKAIGVSAVDLDNSINTQRFRHPDGAGAAM